MELKISLVSYDTIKNMSYQTFPRRKQSLHKFVFKLEMEAVWISVNVNISLNEKETSLFSVYFAWIWHFNQQLIIACKYLHTKFGLEVTNFLTVKQFFNNKPHNKTVQWKQFQNANYLESVVVNLAGQTLLKKKTMKLR